MNPLNLTAEELQSRQYSAALDSVNLVNELLEKPYKSQEDIDNIYRNVEHLKIVVGQGLGSADLTPIQDAIERADQAVLQVSIDPNPEPIAERLPDRAKLHELTSGSELWQHISQYAPGAATLLYIALTASSQLNQTVVTQNIKDMMHLVVAQLGSDHALHSTPSSKITNDPNDPEALSISVGTLADELDNILAESFFPWRYSDLM